MRDRSKPFAVTAPAILAMAELLVNLPFLLSRPTYNREDLFSITSGRINGIWYATDNPESRPVTRVIHNVIFGLLPDHPTLLHWLLTLLMMATVISLHFLTRRFLVEKWAFLVVMAWVVIPTHLSLDHWLDASGVTTGLLLTSIALTLFDRRVCSGQSIWMPVVLLTIVAFTYEAYLVVAVPALPILYFIRKHTLNWRLTAKMLCGPVVAMVITYFMSTGRDRKFVPLSHPLAANVGFLKPNAIAAITVVAIVTLTCGWSAFRLLGRNANQPYWMIVVGSSVFVLGIVPFLSNGFENIYFGLGDRANVMSSFGLILTIAGLLQLVVKQTSLYVIGVFCLALVPSHLDRSQQWIHTQRLEIRAAKQALHDAPPTGRVVIPAEEHKPDGLGSFVDIGAGLWIRSGLLAPTRGYELAHDSLAH